MMSSPDARFGCNITPTQASLADVNAYVAETGKSPLKPGQRDTWLKQLREKLGKQEIEVFGIDPRTRAGLVLVEADYRMKLVGMGLEEGVLGVPSYLQMINVPKGQSPPPMDVLRWWFTLNYDAVAATSEHGRRRDASGSNSTSIAQSSQGRWATIAMALGWTKWSRLKLPNVKAIAPNSAAARFILHRRKNR